MARGRRRLVDARAGPVPDGEVDYGYLLDDDDRRARTRARDASRTACTSGRARFDPATYDWNDGAWTGRQLAGAVIYELHVGTFTPEGTLDAALGRLDHLRSIGVDFVELMPVNAVQRHPQLGLRRRAAGSRCTSRTAARRRTSASSTAATRPASASIQDVVYNHLGPSGNYLPLFGPYLKAGENTWGDLVNLDGEGSARGAPLHPRQRRGCGSTTTTSTGCASTPCTRSTTPPTAPAGGDGDRGRGACPRTSAGRSP